MTPEEVSERLTAFLQRSHNASDVRIENLRLLTGGASRQTWSFDAHVDGQTLALVARAYPRKGPTTMTRETEYRVLEAAYNAGVEDYRYSPAFDRLVGAWTPAELNAFIASPMDYVPGTSMLVKGVEDATQRANLIAFLRQNSDDPFPLPQRP